jgi:hypothetical protein
MDSARPNLSKGFFIERAIQEAANIPEKIDAKWTATVPK